MAFGAEEEKNCSFSSLERGGGVRATLLHATLIGSRLAASTAVSTVPQLLEGCFTVQRPAEPSRLLKNVLTIARFRMRLLQRLT